MHFRNMYWECEFWWKSLKLFLDKMVKCWKKQTSINKSYAYTYTYWSPPRIWIQYGTFNMKHNSFFNHNHFFLSIWTFFTLRYLCVEFKRWKSTLKESILFEILKCYKEFLNSANLYCKMSKLIQSLCIFNNFKQIWSNLFSE